MKKKFWLVMTAFAISVLMANAASAQFTITIPKLPKIKKPKVETTTATPDATPEPPRDRSVDTTSRTTVKTDDEPMDFRLKFFLDEVTQTKKSVEEFDEQTKLYMVNANQTDWLMRAISPRRRAEWMQKWTTKPAEIAKFNAALDSLKASADTKLPSYKGDLATYKVRNPADEKLMRTALTKIADYKIYSSGVMQPSWKIDKDDYGLPQARYKNGAFWLRDTKDDHPYCYLTYVNIVQDYAGGGTYGASEARFVGDKIVACPAAK
jgi:hypothetical protein